MDAECVKTTIKTLKEAKKTIRGITKKSYMDNGSIGTVLVQTYGECVGKRISNKFLSFGKVVGLSKTWEPIAAKREDLLKAIDEKIEKLQSRLPPKKSRKTKSKVSGGDANWIQAEQQLEKFSLFGGEYLNESDAEEGK
jgi:ABC-type Fe3+-hydroxamate transport system substrate-binding protein